MSTLSNYDDYPPRKPTVTKKERRPLRRGTVMIVVSTILSIPVAYVLLSVIIFDTAISAAQSGAATALGLIDLCLWIVTLSVYYTYYNERR